MVTTPRWQVLPECKQQAGSHRRHLSRHVSCAKAGSLGLEYEHFRNLRAELEGAERKKDAPGKLMGSSSSPA